MPSIKGTASVTDNRALNKRLASLKFPANFSEKFDPDTVNRAVLTQWIEQKITELLGFEDEIVQSTAVNLFLPSRVEDGPKVEVNPKKAQIDLEGFLGEESAAKFAAEAWDLLLDAQSSGVGVPKILVEQKKKELEAQRAQAAARQPYNPPSQYGRRPPPPDNYYNNRGPPSRQGPRRSVSPERRPGRDEFGRTARLDSHHDRDDRRRSPPYEIDRRPPPLPRDQNRRRYDRRNSPPPQYHRRDYPEDHRRPPRDDRYRYPDDQEDDRERPTRRRSRSRSPPPSRRSRRRSRSSSSSAGSSRSDSSRSSRRSR